MIGFIEEQVEELYDWDNEDGDSVDGLTRGMRNVVVKNGWEVKDVEEAVVGGYDGLGWWFPGFVGEFVRFCFVSYACLGRKEVVKYLVRGVFELSLDFLAACGFDRMGLR